MSFLAAAAITVAAAGDLQNLAVVLLSSPRIKFVLVSGLIATLIGAILATSALLKKIVLLVALLISIVMFATAAVQTSIVLLFVLLWAWSLYKLHINERA